ncbi:cyclase family protein [Cupriavidus basilensis]
MIDASGPGSRRPRLDPDRALPAGMGSEHGQIPAGAWVLLRTDWSKKTDPQEFLGLREDGAHTPGPTQEAVEWLIQERNVHGFGVETINTDAGQSYAWPVPYPATR